MVQVHSSKVAGTQASVKTVDVSGASRNRAGENPGRDSVPAAGWRRGPQRPKTRAKITRAARPLCARKGFDATTPQEIAAKADIGTGTLFNYAKTKEDLLLL